MQTLAIWFEDLSLCPERAEAGIMPSAGMPELWLDMIVGYGKILKKRYTQVGVLEAVVVGLFPDKGCSAQFQITLRQLSQQLGTNAWIRDYDDSKFRASWDAGLPLFSSH